jgi:hypothetical protein
MTDPIDAAKALVGTYKLCSMKVELDDGTIVERPSTGYIIITPKRFTAIIASNDRKAGSDAVEKAALLDTLVAYTGSYTIEGQKLVTDVDVSWNQSWTGTKQRRTWTFDGKELKLASDPAASPSGPTGSVVARLEWEKIE